MWVKNPFCTQVSFNDTQDHFPLHVIEKSAETESKDDLVGDRLQQVGNLQKGPKVLIHGGAYSNFLKMCLVHQTNNPILEQKYSEGTTGLLKSCALSKNRSKRLAGTLQDLSLTNDLVT